MRKDATRKLTLKKESLRDLSRDDLARVAGGLTGPETISLQLPTCLPSFHCTPDLN